MTGPAAWLRRHHKIIVVIVLLIVLALGLTALHTLTREIRAVDIHAALRAIPPIHILSSLGLTAVSYLALTMYDYTALRVIGHPLPWRTAALASFTSYALSHNLGLGWLTGGSARYRVYTAVGIDAFDIARIVAITATMFWMGVLVLAGAALGFHRGPVAVNSWMLSQAGAQAIGLGILMVGAGFLMICARGAHRIRAFGWELPLPTGRQAAAQYLIAVVDLAAASAALFALVPGAEPALLPSFILAYAIAIIAALISHVPGGIGVFEAVLIAVLPSDKSALLAALILYRLIYYIIPLVLGVMLLVFHEGARLRAPAARAFSSVQAIARAVAPLAMAVASFVGGGVLLLSGSLPAIPSRLHALAGIVPLPFIEASHMAASVAGTALLLLAPGLLRRLDGAFVATRALLLAGAVFSLLKGFDFEEASVCLIIAALLQWTHPAFYRRTALTGEPLSPRWLAAAAAAIAIISFIGFFAFKNVDYRNELWWQFALNGDASRFLRATLVSMLLIATFACWRLFAPARVATDPATTDIAVIRPALASARHTDAMLALTGDKRFLMSPEADAFVMYQISGRTWIVMADPVGPRERWPELLWTIHGMADAAQGRLLLYQISADMLELAIDLGLEVIKYGEEALIDLGRFSLNGTAVKSLRQATRRAEREGLRFCVIPSSEISLLLPELSAVSDAWLASKGHAEKGFSLGRFDPDYLSEFDMAVIRHDDRIVAFANIWVTPDRGEASIDLMRHADEAPSGTMDFLFVQLMFWAKAKGYAMFSMGLAPLSGIAARPLAPTWAKIAALVFNHGERFYGFRGLRSYKAKFQPSWQARYIAGSHGLAIVPALLDLNKLIGTAPK